MTRSLESNYSREEFLEATDELDGLTITLENSVDSYIGSLGDYITGNTSLYELDQSIKLVTRNLEMLYDCLDSFDKMIEEENLVAKVVKDGETGVSYLEEDLSTMSNGVFSEISSFYDVLTLNDLLEDKDVDADREYLDRAERVGAPTQLVADRDRLNKIGDRLDWNYNRITFGEILARRQTDVEDPLKTFEPEPPIFRMLGHEDHSERVQRLYKEFKKNR